MFQTIPDRRNDRWQLMETILAAWVRPLHAQDRTPAHRLDAAENRLGIRIPRALREWYELAGQAENIWNVQDHILPPERLAVRDDVLVFCVENQGIWSMGASLAHPEQEDPPVFGWMNEAWDEPTEFGPFNSSVSEATLQYLAWCLGINVCFRYGPGARRRYGEGIWGDGALAAIEQAYVRCAFPTWRLWGYDTVFYEGEDLLIQISHTSPEDDSPRLRVATRTDAALAGFVNLMERAEFSWGLRP